MKMRTALHKPLAFLFVAAILGFASVPNAQALQLDWSGQFWFDSNWLNNYQLDRSRPGYDNDASYTSNGGPYVPGTGEKNVFWHSVFLKLKPKAVVNDNLSIKSEFQVGTPIYGFLGTNYPANPDQGLNFTGSSRDNATIGAQRFWANWITDVGTVEVGRAPLQWGLGALWNAGDNPFDRYQSTGDMIRLTSKFGNFSISPALVKVAVGNNLAGASDYYGNIIQGNDDVTDYDLAIKYDNPEEDFEFGLFFTHRVGNAAQRAMLFNTSFPPSSTKVNFNIFDIYMKKKIGHFTLGGEVPIFSGTTIGSMDTLNPTNQYTYKSYAIAFEGNYSSDLWDVGLKAGHAPGQTPLNSSSNTFREVYLNDDYLLGLIMFHYNLYGLNNNNPATLPPGVTHPNSPYNNPITNANYGMLAPSLKLDKWTLKTALVFAYADQAAQAGTEFYNANQHQTYNANANQQKFMGKEFDLGVSFKWDENLLLAWDVGFFFPGAYYQFTNIVGAPPLGTDMMFASQVRAAITF